MMRKTFIPLQLKRLQHVRRKEFLHTHGVKNGDIAFDVTGDVSDAQSAHTDLAYVAAVAPTCTDAGKIAHAYCDGCKKYYNVTGDASSYTIGEEITEGAAGLTGDPATGHSYAVSFDSEEDYTTALGTADGQYTVDCANECGTETTIALPALTAENTWTKSEEVAATCMNPGTATFTATVSSVTVVVKGVQTAPATGTAQRSALPLPTTLRAIRATISWTKAWKRPAAPATEQSRLR